MIWELKRKILIVANDEYLSNKKTAKNQSNLSFSIFSS